MPYKANKATGNTESLLFTLVAKGMTSKKFMAITQSRRAVLHLLGNTAIRVYQNKFKSHNPAPRINPKPIRLLTIMARSDLNLSQAAEKLCISIDTANKHMALAKEMLGSRSQANAVYRAIQKGLIDFD
jgi:DNA-binding CsgD family transcriptional regulator